MLLTVCAGNLVESDQPRALLSRRWQARKSIPCCRQERSATTFLQRYVVYTSFSLSLLPLFFLFVFFHAWVSLSAAFSRGCARALSVCVRFVLRVMHFDWCCFYYSIQNSLQCSSFAGRKSPCNILQHTTTHCNTLQDTAARRNTLPHTSCFVPNSPSQCNTLHHAAPPCSTLQRIWFQPCHLMQCTSRDVSRNSCRWNTRKTHREQNDVWKE